MPDQPGEFASRLEACLAGALQATPPNQMSLFNDLLLTCEVLADSGGQGPEALRLAGLTALPKGGLGATVLRAIPFGVLTPRDRPRIRRDAYHCALQAGADEGTAMVAVATAMLASDLMSHDLETSLMRVHQTLLEEAPSELLRRLCPAQPGSLGDGDSDPLLALQLAISALAQAEGPTEVVAALRRISAEAPLAPVPPSSEGSEDGPLEERSAEDSGLSPEAEMAVAAAGDTGDAVVVEQAQLAVAPILAAALAGLRDGGATIPSDHPLRDRLRRDLAAFAAAAAFPGATAVAVGVVEPQASGG